MTLEDGRSCELPTCESGSPPIGSWRPSDSCTIAGKAAALARRQIRAHHRSYALHHRELNVAGDGRAWWAERKIDALQFAKGLREVARTSVKLRIMIDKEPNAELGSKTNGSGAE